jgi:hypothetical protein
MEDMKVRISNLKTDEDIMAFLESTKDLPVNESIEIGKMLVAKLNQDGIAGRLVDFVNDTELSAAWVKWSKKIINPLYDMKFKK